MTATLHLWGELGRYLVVEAHGYEREEALEPSDANWLRCTVKAVIGPHFCGTVDAAFTTRDLARFELELERIERGASTRASFEPMEPALTLQIQVDRAGHAHMQGVLRDIEAEGPSLHFSIQGDLASLARARAEVSEIISRFPERFPTA